MKLLCAILLLALAGSANAAGRQDDFADPSWGRHAGWVDAWQGNPVPNLRGKSKAWEEAYYRGQREAMVVIRERERRIRDSFAPILHWSNGLRVYDPTFGEKR